MFSDENHIRWFLPHSQWDITFYNGDKMRFFTVTDPDDLHYTLADSTCEISADLENDWPNHDPNGPVE